jgi:hypothetical protein
MPKRIDGELVYESTEPSAFEATHKAIEAALRYVAVSKRVNEARNKLLRWEKRNPIHLHTYHKPGQYEEHRVLDECLTLAYKSLAEARAELTSTMDEEELYDPDHEAERP